MSRSSRHVARDRITSSRLSRQLASGGAPFIFRRVSEAAPSSRAADDRRSQSNADRVLAIARIHLYLPILSLSFFLLLTRSSVSLPSSFSPISPTSAAPHSAALLTLSRSCVSYVRTNSISRDSLRSGSAVNYFSSSRSRPALLRTCASRPFSPRLVHLVLLFFVPLTGSISSSSL